MVHEEEKGEQAVMACSPFPVFEVRCYGFSMIVPRSVVAPSDTETAADE